MKTKFFKNDVVILETDKDVNEQIGNDIILPIGENQDETLFTIENITSQYRLDAHNRLSKSGQWIVLD